MTKLTQKTIIHTIADATKTWITYHIYTPGVFKKDGKSQGWHIESQNENIDQEYTEDLTVQHGNPIPTSLPDIDVYEEPEDSDEPATNEDYKQALEMLGVVFDD